jgi:hypothetical protein
VALPRTASTEAGEAVDLPKRLRWMRRSLLPRMNAGLAALYTEEILDLARSWEQRAWPEMCHLMPMAGIPSRVARGALETVGRILVSQAARRQAFSVLRGTWDSDLEQLLGQGKIYPAVLHAREAWKARQVTCRAGLGPPHRRAGRAPDQHRPRRIPVCLHPHSLRRKIPPAGCPGRHRPGCRPRIPARKTAGTTLRSPPERGARTGSPTPWRVHHRR